MKRSEECINYFNGWSRFKLLFSNGVVAVSLGVVLFTLKMSLAASLIGGGSMVEMSRGSHLGNCALKSGNLDTPGHVISVMRTCVQCCF